jgi:competence ComEA-like helix-hairpin-helix protein
MPTAAERKALSFLVAMAVLGGGVRVVGVQRFERDVARASSRSPPADLAARALDAQIAAVDSARAAPRAGRSRGGRSRRPANGDNAGGNSSSRSPEQPTLTPEQLRPAPALVDMNSASAEELERLPRVGPALARRIVAWREEHGPFAGLDDLRHVRGIGPATVRLLAPLVTFSPRHSPIPSEGVSLPQDLSCSA